eukprot:COSAG01_NODE_34865_length_540_cov_9.108844_1_plen_93_part_10
MPSAVLTEMFAHVRAPPPPSTGTVQYFCMWYSCSLFVPVLNPVHVATYLVLCSTCMLYRYVWIYGIDSTGSRPWLLDRACLPVVACYLLPAAA